MITSYVPLGVMAAQRLVVTERLLAVDHAAVACAAKGWGAVIELV
jgi:hypothetical protein